MGFLCQDSIEELFFWLVHMIWLSFKDSNVLEADKIQEMQLGVVYLNKQNSMSFQNHSKV